MSNFIYFYIEDFYFFIPFFLFNFYINRTVYFKVYAGMNTDAWFYFFIGDGMCPTFIWSYTQYWNVTYPNDVIIHKTEILFFCLKIRRYAYGIAELALNVVEGAKYVLFVHIQGTNYTIVGDNKPIKGMSLMTW